MLCELTIPNTNSQRPKLSPEPKTKDQIPIPKDQYPKTKDQRPIAKDQIPPPQLLKINSHPFFTSSFFVRIKIIAIAVVTIPITKAPIAPSIA